MPSTNASASRSVWASARLFVGTLGRGWWAVVLGVVAGLLGFYQQVSGQEIALPLWAWYGASVLGILTGAFIAFHRTRLERDDLAAELERRTPHMELKILDATSYWDENNNKMMAYLNVVVVNRYQRAAILRWGGKATLTDGREFPLRPVAPYTNEAMPVFTEKGEVRLIRLASLITHKTAHPIEDGAFASGGYLGWMVGADENVPISEGDTFHLWCMDTHDQTWRASFTAEYIKEISSPFGSDDLVLGPSTPEGDGA